MPGNLSGATATLARWRAKLKAGNVAHRISAPAFASSTGERGPRAGASLLGQVAERDSSPAQEIAFEPKLFRPQSTDFSSGIDSSAAFCSPRPECPSSGNTRDTLSPTMGDTWASMVNTPHLPMSQKMSTATKSGTGPTQMANLATAKLNDCSTNFHKTHSPTRYARCLRCRLQWCAEWVIQTPRQFHWTPCDLVTPTFSDKRQLKKGRKNRPPTLFLSLSSIMPQKIPVNYNATPMKTRSRNKGQHPGAPDAPKPRRSHAEMETIRREHAEKKQAEQETKQRALERVANVEDGLREEDVARQAERQASAKKERAKATVTGMYPCVHGKGSLVFMFD